LACVCVYQSMCLSVLLVSGLCTMSLRKPGAQLWWPLFDVCCHYHVKYV